jgi:hypothetical protein
MAAKKRKTILAAVPKCGPSLRSPLVRFFRLVMGKGLPPGPLNLDCTMSSSFFALKTLYHAARETKVMRRTSE